MARKFNIFTGRWDEIGTPSTATGTVTSISAGVGITLTPNPITTTGTVAQSNTAVTPGTYGDSTHVGQFTVDQQGNLTFAANVAISDPADGTVTSVAQTVPPEFTISGSPITTSGTLAIGKANENANTVWAGPVSGAAAQPTFRLLDETDIPANITGTFGQRQVTGTTSNVVSNLFLGAVSNTGTVTNASDATGLWLNLNTTTTNGAATTLSTSGAGGGTEFVTDVPGVVWVIIKTGPATTDIQNVRIWFTYSVGAPQTVDTLGATGMGFRFSTNTADSNWQAVTRDAAVQQTTDTGVVVAANTKYVLKIDSRDSANIKFQINGGTVFTNSTHVPVNTSQLNMFFTITNLAGGTARNVLWRRQTNVWTAG